MFVRAQAPNIGLIWIERLDDAVKDTQRAKDAEHVLQAHASIATLEADHCAARDIRPVGQLRLRQTAQLSPCGNVVCRVTKGTPDRGRDDAHPTIITPFFILLLHIAITIARSATYISLYLSAAAEGSLSTP